MTTIEGCTCEEHCRKCGRKWAKVVKMPAGKQEITAKICGACGDRELSIVGSHAVSDCWACAQFTCGLCQDFLNQG